MILIVVAVLAVAANQVQVWYLVNVLTNAIDVFLVTVVINRIGLGHSYYNTIYDLISINQTQLSGFLLAQLDERVVISGP